MRLMSHLHILKAIKALIKTQIKVSMIANITELTKREQTKLQNQIIGYGNLAKASRKTGLSADTIKRISEVGRGTEESITIIRENLLTA